MARLQSLTKGIGKFFEYENQFSDLTSFLEAPLL